MADDLTQLSDKQLREAIRAAKNALAIAKRESATSYKAYASCRALAFEKQAALELLRSDAQRRIDEAVKEVQAWREEQSNFENQLQAIADVVMRYFPDDLMKAHNIPEAVKRIVERFGSPAARQHEPTPKFQPNK